MFPSLKRKPFEIVGIPEIDDLFSKCQAPLDTLCECSEAIEKASEGLEDIDKIKKEGITPGKDLSSILKFLLEQVQLSGGKLDLQWNAGSLALTVTGASNNVLIKVINDVNTLISSMCLVIKKSPEIIEQLIEFGKTAVEFAEKVKDLASSAGLGPFAIVKAIKNTALNVKYLGGVPNDIKEFLKAIKDIVDAVKELFGVSDDKDDKKSEEPKQNEKQNDSDEKKGESKENHDAVVLQLDIQENDRISPKIIHAPPKNPVKVAIKRLNKRGGVEINLPDTLEELLQMGGLLGIKAVNVRRNVSEVVITQIDFIQNGDVVYLTDENDEQQFV